MSKDYDLLSLKLHVDDKGEVWYLNADDAPVQTHLPVVAFLLQPLQANAPRIRMMCVSQNLQLMLAIYSLRLQAGSGLIEVCSPTACNTVAARSNPASVLYSLRQYEVASSVGGWHDITREDYIAYALALHLQKVDIVDDHARRLLKSHPVWPALSFIPHISIDRCCLLLSLILDPRWYINQINPNRGSRLRSYLGLDLRTMLGVCGEAKPKRYHHRCELSVNAWSGPNTLTLIEQPNYFLYRIFRDSGQKYGPVVAALRATQAFIEYIRLTWLDAVGRERNPTNPIFVSDYFFNLKYEAVAFKNHIAKQMEI